MPWNCHAGCEGRRDTRSTFQTGESLTMRTDAAFSDFVHFFRSWISNPLRVASVTPSGESLARLITQEISAMDGPIIELGPGTGVFTRALMARGVAQSDLTLIEYGPEFVPGLQRRFPEARILQMDAAKLAQSHIFDGDEVGAVISGLPLLSMSPRKVTAILGGAFTYIRPGGAFYQFTYGPRCPVPRPILDRLGLKAVHIGHTVRNLPPAAVYRISRRKPLEIARDRSRDRNEAEVVVLPGNDNAAH
jgi:phosphatidylethanolamine/phosphatidyl-N-methylethanolamine N-methyltransferase